MSFLHSKNIFFPYCDLQALQNLRYIDHMSDLIKNEHNVKSSD